MKAKKKTIISYLKEMKWKNKTTNLNDIFVVVVAVCVIVVLLQTLHLDANAIVSPFQKSKSHWLEKDKETEKKKIMKEFKNSLRTIDHWLQTQDYKQFYAKSVFPAFIFVVCVLNFQLIRNRNTRYNNSCFIHLFLYWY